MSFLLYKHIKLIIFLSLAFIFLFLSCNLSEHYEIMNKCYSVKYKGTITKMWVSNDNDKYHIEITPYNTSLYKKYTFCVTHNEYYNTIEGERVVLEKMVPKKDVVKGYVVPKEEEKLYRIIAIEEGIIVVMILGILISLIALFLDDD